MIESNQSSIRKAYHPDDLVILVVEDHRLFIKEIKHALPQHRVVLARSVEEAKAKFDEHLPNVTFLDIDLPDGTGFELLDYIRAQEPSAFVVMLTGSQIESDVVTSRMKGARGYVLKPFTKSKLDRHIVEYLGQRKKEIEALIAETGRHRRDTLVLTPNMIVRTE